MPSCRGSHRVRTSSSGLRPRAIRRPPLPPAMPHLWSAIWSGDSLFQLVCVTLAYLGTSFPSWQGTTPWTSASSKPLGNLKSGEICGVQHIPRTRPCARLHRHSRIHSHPPVRPPTRGRSQAVVGGKRGKLSALPDQFRDLHHRRYSRSEEHTSELQSRQY